jgi:hypothetical protein
MQIRQHYDGSSVISSMGALSCIVVGVNSKNLFIFPIAIGHPPTLSLGSL